MRQITLICALAAALQLLSPTDASAAGGWTWPIRGPVITSYRNGADPYASGQHRGVDIAAPVGTRVVAATGGTVTFAGVVGSSGLVVSERTADGRFDLSYLHLSSASVRRGDSLAAGAAVGAVGTTGRRSAEAPHLHFGVREAGDRNAYRDPLDFLAPPAAGDRPEPAPAPVPVGAPAVSDPAPVPSGAPAVGSPVPALADAPAPNPSRAGGHSSAGNVGPAPLGTPGHAPVGTAHRAAPLPRIIAAAGPPKDLRDSRAHEAPPGRAAAGPRAGSPGRRAMQHRSDAPQSAHPHHGIDVGWLAACLGLIAAATALGHPDATRRAAARGRARTARVRTALTTLLHTASRSDPAR